MNASKLPFWAQALLFLSAVGCSDGAITKPREAPVEPIPGGGTRGDELDNELALVALDARTDAPIAAAQIWLGEGTSAKAVGFTDERGQLRIHESAVKEALALGSSVAVTAVKSGFVTTSYVGVDRETLTIALRPQAEAVDEVVVTTYLLGFEPLPSPAAGEYWLGSAAVSRQVGFLDDDLAEAQAAPPPTCRWVNNTTSCVLTLTARPGTHTLFGVVAKGKDSGTPADPSDDTLEVMKVNSLTLDLPAEKPDELIAIPQVKTPLTSLVVAPAAAPAGMNRVIGVPGINRSGDVMVFPDLPSEVSTWAVPVADGEFSEEVLWGVATAASSDGSQRARVIRKGLMAPTSPATAPIDASTSAFLEATSVSVDGSALVVDAPPDTTIHRLKLRRGNEFLMDVLLLEATSFTPPSSLVTPGPADAEISSLEATAAPEEFSLRKLYLDLSRDSTAEKQLALP